MKVAVIGHGKTGREVLNLVSAENIVGPFDSTHLPTEQALLAADVAIIFVPGESMQNLIAPLIRAQIPVICGSTGFEWPDNLDVKLKELSLTWVFGSNFSMGIAITRQLIQQLSSLDPLLKTPSYHIHEIHHAHKKDAPSGTALSWKQWLGKDCEVTSERQGDVIGQHILEVSTPFETIKLEHQAHDRAVFAHGALWTAQQVHSGSFSTTGLHPFESVISTNAHAR